MPSGYLFIQVLSLVILLHVPLSVVVSLWLYRKQKSTRDLMFWMIMTWLIPVVGAVAAIIHCRRFGLGHKRTIRNEENSAPS